MDKLKMKNRVQDLKKYTTGTGMVINFTNPYYSSMGENNLT